MLLSLIFIFIQDAFTPYHRVRRGKEDFNKKGVFLYLHSSKRRKERQQDTSLCNLERTIESIHRLLTYAKEGSTRGAPFQE